MPMAAAVSGLGISWGSGLVLDWGREKDDGEVRETWCRPREAPAKGCLKNFPNPASKSHFLVSFWSEKATFWTGVVTICPQKATSWTGPVKFRPRKATFGTIKSQIFGLKKPLFGATLGGSFTGPLGAVSRSSTEVRAHHRGWATLGQPVALLAWLRREQGE
ncbi:hypothetical protein DFH09DRAFT_1069559 [Mycena vulgaris]|nr:hypothetical protein DFH09DRAFT_1069559 [Mycena vulgaris]